MKKNLKQIMMALEEQASGKASFEREYVFYARLSDKRLLDKATHVETQEQWTVKIAKNDSNHASGTIRIRRTDDNDKVSYVLTIKTPVKPLERDTAKSDTVVADASQNMLEVAIDASEDAFEQFKMISEQGMKKTRYTFPIDGTDLKFEVDLFDGQKDDKPWVKIDLEVKQHLDSIPQLPSGFEEIIYNQKDEQTQQEKDIIWNLYEKIFLIKNVYL
jgi:CYTH domain-containing protein